MIEDQIGVDRGPDVVRQSRICTTPLERVEFPVFEIAQSR